MSGNLNPVPHVNPDSMLFKISAENLVEGHSFRVHKPGTKSAISETRKFSFVFQIYYYEEMIICQSLLTSFSVN